MRIRALLLLLLLLGLAGCSYFVVFSRLSADHCVEWARGDAVPPVHCRDLVPAPAR
jgi:hypothetical protein